MPALNATEILPLVARMKAALARKDRTETNRVVAALLDGAAPLGEQWQAISQLMQVSGEFNLALRAIDAFIASAADKPRARYSKVVLLTQAQRLQEAQDLLTQLPEDVPDRAGRAYVLGNTAMTLGRIDEARAHLLTALKHRPGWGPAWLSLVMVGNLKTDPIGEQLLAERSVAERQGPADLARYHYALGKLHVDRGDHAAAFAAFARGAALLKSLTPYGREANAANAESTMTGYSHDFFDRMREKQTIDTSRPIFVTGLPRSGTTLVEQILASHSAVLDGGELNFVQHMAVSVGGVSGDAVAQYVARGGSLDDLGGLYLHLLEERFGPTGRIVDKTIDVSRCMGLIAAALPDAPLIWMRRDPLDSAWSCFRTFFIHGVAWSFDLEDIAHHFQLEDRLMAFWKEQLGDRLLVVPYGALVEDPALWTARLLAHCGLDEEAAAYTPHLTERRVATASSLQVRRPINRDGLGVAEPYREFLQPFIDAYYGNESAAAV
ncbi:tetratricopeptide repeat-containing sulfotransferase family protein [Sphingomonas sp. Leaf357]|uniref:tetratricopeptide repeat-containing sulfotransferase family protein n=1 Tax=Sphingomonas sp. Leaf357 TaxID=1736350 RepID=UPI0009EBF766|nr:sulfotransferase [Sphingomonas sp. Leaf357]